MTKLRALGRIRLSRDSGDEGTSVERQREAIEQFSAMHGHTVVGWAVDSGVSGSVDPFSAPELGPWLREPQLSEWDVLVASRLDRLARRVIPLNKLFGFVLENGKTVASVSESLDLSTWIGRLVANVIAGVAEGELEAISERNAGSQKKVRELGRWHGGQALPYGYNAVKRSDGWYLEHNPEQVKVICAEIVPRVMAHQSTNSIARALNEAGIPTKKGGKWSGQFLRKMLRGRPLLGQMESKGRLVTDENGLPIQRAEPILTADEFDKLQLMLSQRAVRHSEHTSNPLAGVAFCYECERPMYQQLRTGRDYDYYICSARIGGRGLTCTSLNIRSDELLEIVEDWVLHEIGELERREKVYVPGSDHSQALSAVRSALDTARREKDLGLYDGDDEQYFKRLERLIGRREELQQLPSSQPGFRWEPLGETYGQAWKRMTAEERRTLLLDAKIRVYFSLTEGKHTKTRLELPVDVRLQIEEG